ncbi:MAG TPA: hypothetical protein VEJ19_08645 [Nitrososphaerales archaeon]|nr:hypothetical protein [Nitrososphaerales archaeon]
MTLYFGLWRLNRNIQPAPTPEAQVMQQEAFVAMIKAQLQMGRIKEAQTYVEGGGGYFVYDGTEEQIHEDVSLWDPYVIFEIHRTIPLQRAAELELAAFKKRAGKA